MNFLLTSCPPADQSDDLPPEEPAQSEENLTEVVVNDPPPMIENPPAEDPIAATTEEIVIKDPVEKIAIDRSSNLSSETSTEEKSLAQEEYPPTEESIEISTL